MTTETKVRYNQISQELKDEVRKHYPEKGQTIYFEVLKKKKVKRGGVLVDQFPNSVRIPSTDTIYDPFTKEWVDIAHLQSERDGTLKDIIIQGSDGGRIAIRGSVPQDLKLFEYLFLTNFNQTAKGKVEKSRPQCGYLIKEVQPALTARQKLEFNKKVREAQGAIDLFPEELLRSYAIGLNLRGITPFSDLDEIRLQLDEIAQKTPDEILQFDRDFDKKFEIKVKVLQEKGIIEHQNGKWIWGFNQETLCTHAVGADKIEALKKHISENPETKEILDQKLEASKA